ncbi:hypothetical protein HCN44_000637 [Aphidius gifuensis]|uniref:WAP domain-containing protein n=1 Tax=Aphidius gifuensis TaxID=684658 RepID=A0A834XSI0_APHGI|nr:antileukoproteinase-like isoform X2 [Aphidius gifuensis]KAF7990832.1 hypothetical protein HCN44_000637 [Aphidius gifuensis]
MDLKKGSCPRRKTVYHCEPTCMNDYQCPSSQKCCPNKCGSVSCVEASPVYTGNNGPYRGIIKHSHVFCGGMKCTKWEKCELERNTKRARCVRV